MRVAGCVHFSMPWRNCGSEVVIQELMKAAVAAGHEASVWVTNKDALRNWTGREPETVLDGVRIHRVRNPLIGMQQIARWKADVIVSHHDHASLTIRKAKTIGARSVFLTHNQMDLNKRPLQLRPDLVIHNSEWVRESLQRFGEQSQEFVFHPPLTPDRHRVPAIGNKVTLCNLNEDKGANLFYELAAKLPDTEFLGVVGGHGKQVIRRAPNVTIHPHTPDMREVWSQTRVLLMPSIYESYGLVAQEAGLNGIPTIAHPTPGLRENLGKHGLFAHRETPHEWIQQLRALEDPETFQRASAHAQVQAAEAMDATRASLKTWVEWIG